MSSPLIVSDLTYLSKITVVAFTIVIIVADEIVYLLWRGRDLPRREVVVAGVNDCACFLASHVRRPSLCRPNC